MDIILINSTWPPNKGDYCSKIVLNYDNWNDYNYYTSFGMYYCDENGNVYEIGSLKIYYYNNDEARTNNYSEHTRHYLENSIEQLGTLFCSLGQDLSYYRNIKKFLPNVYLEILERLNDIAIFEKIRKQFINEKGVQISLLRFSGAEKALTEAKDIISDRKSIEKNISFSYKVSVPYCEIDTVLKFDFQKSDIIPYRINILVGKNGTGKTQILSRLANSLSGYTDNREVDSFLGKRPPIDRVMSISYSAFDSFRKLNPRKNNNESRSVFSYVYCGIQSEKGTLSLDQLKSNLKNSYTQVKARNRQDIWLDILSALMEEEHKRTVELIALEQFEDVNLSSGQQILICTITELIANIENESIILFDEPEIHLHPNAISNVLRMFYKLLEEFNSYAIFSTHSPLVLQEIPSKYIQILDRVSGILSVRKPDIECFGNSINNIIYDVFDVTTNESNFKTVLSNLSKDKSYQEVIEFFDGRLGLNALIYLKNLYDLEDD